MYSEKRFAKVKNIRENLPEYFGSSKHYINIKICIFFHFNIANFSFLLSKQYLFIEIKK